jgi:MFS family permease
MTADSPIWLILGYLFLMGVGIGLGMQILVLIVQNSFPNSEVGTATASNNFFREIGASLGGAVVGAMFTGRLSDLFAERLPAASDDSLGLNSLTPALVNALPEEIRTIIVGAYNDALTPVFLSLLPMILIGFVLLLFVKEAPLRATLEDATEGDVAPALTVQATGESGRRERVARPAILGGSDQTEPQ